MERGVADHEGKLIIGKWQRGCRRLAEFQASGQSALRGMLPGER